MNVYRIAFLMLSVSVLSACSNFPSTGGSGYERPAPNPETDLEPRSELQLNEGDILLKVTDEGAIVPVTEDGKEYVECSDDRAAKNACRIFEGGITVKDLDAITVTRLRYTGSGQCEVLSFFNPIIGRMVFVYNPNDLDCREHHQ